MIEYEIIDKAELPDKYVNKWLYLFTRLSLDKAIKIAFPTSKEAKSVQSNLLSQFRKSKGFNFKLSTRFVRPDEGNGEFTLFIWKEEK